LLITTVLFILISSGTNNIIDIIVYCNVFKASVAQSVCPCIYLYSLWGFPGILTLQKAMLLRIADRKLSFLFFRELVAARSNKLTAN